MLLQCTRYHKMSYHSSLISWACGEKLSLCFFWTKVKDSSKYSDEIGEKFLVEALIIDASVMMIHMCVVYAVKEDAE